MVSKIAGFALRHLNQQGANFLLYVRRNSTSGDNRLASGQQLSRSQQHITPQGTTIKLTLTIGEVPVIDQLDCDVIRMQGRRLAGT